MWNKYHILQTFILLLVCLNICNGRVVYLLAHAEKPGDGKLEENNDDLMRVSSMDGLGFSDDGLVCTLLIG